MARPASDIAERVVAAARVRFLAEGVDGASLRAIAREAGTNVGMIYYYFPTKDELFLAVVEGTYGRVLEDIKRELTADHASTSDQVHGLFAYFASLSDDDMQVIRLVMREALVSSTRMGRLFERFSRGHLPLLVGMLSTGVRRGDVRGDLPTLALVIGTVSLGLFPQVLLQRLREAAAPVGALLPSRERMAHALAQVLLEGVQAMAERTPRPPP